MFMVYEAFIKNHTRILQFLGAFLFGLSIGVALVRLLCLFSVIDLNPKQYVYVDIEKIIASVNEGLKQQIEEKQLSEALVGGKLNLAKDKFNLLLDGYVKENNAVVFSSTKVIAGAKNVTEYFTDEILAGIK